MPPAELFKYREDNLNTILTILNRGIWFSSPQNLNDPFDSLIKFEDKKVNKDSMWKQYQGYLERSKNLAMTLSKGQFDKLFEGDEPSCKLQKEVRDFVSTFHVARTEMGVLSLSEVSDDMRMWAHYSNEHKGVCFGVRPMYLVDIPLEELFSRTGLYEDLSTSIRKVGYFEAESITNNAYELYAMCGLGGTPEIQQNVLLNMLSVKTSDWAYEKEWRIIRGRGNSMQGFTDEFLTSITFGLKTSEPIKRAIHNIVAFSFKKTIPIYQIIKDQSHPQLLRRKIDDSSDWWIKPYEE